MSHSPLVTVVIPTYNQADYLKECLESVLAQTCTDWEAIVINNFSEDHTQEVALSFGDPRIRLINFANQGVIAASRNRGIQEAQGQWVAFLDSDDLWLPHKLETCLAQVPPKAGLITHRAVRFMGDQDLGLTPAFRPQAQEYKNLLFFGNCLTPTNCLVRRDLLQEVGGFSEEPPLITVEDFDLWLKLIEAGVQVHALDQPLARYRVHFSSNSNAVGRHLAAELTLLRRRFAQLSPKSGLDYLWFIRIIGIQYYGAGRQAHAQGRRLSALGYYLRSFWIFPFYPKLYVAVLLALIPGA